jgi:hypothetical protein
MLVGDADRGQFLALLGEYLDALINAAGMCWAFGGLFVIKIDGSGAGSLGVGGHLEFFGSGVLELGDKKGRGCEDEGQEEVAHEDGNPHEFSFAWKQQAT